MDLHCYGNLKNLSMAARIGSSAIFNLIDDLEDIYIIVMNYL
jgi:hypothetical protein